MFSSRLIAVFSVLALGLAGANAETHTISFENSCGEGTPQLIINGANVLANGELSFTSDGPISGAVVFLQTGSCGVNGEGCLDVETALQTGQSTTDLSLIPPFAFSVATRFMYTNGCDGFGSLCAAADCVGAVHNETDQAQKLSCFADDVNLRVAFCETASGPPPSA
ncbi:hypothetical protein OF83DRAFT_1168318 [Amylostereum chailletii]|nr:hypothetical protein OF83DRAFT_1168318 [Amylostereum chailletii]